MKKDEEIKFLVSENHSLFPYKTDWCFLIFSIVIFSQMNSKEERISE